MHPAPNPFGLSQRGLRSRQQPISYLMAQAVTNPGLISLAAGLVDYDLLPTGETAELAAEVLAHPRTGRVALQYGTTPGLARLRELLLRHMEQLDGAGPGGLGGGPDDVVVTTGSQQMLFLLSDLLVDPGDIVITGWPSYFVYTGTLETLGADVRCVDVDDDGMVPEALERLLDQIQAEGRLDRVKIVYVVSYHQNPTGLTVSAERRPRLLEIVKRFSRRHRILLLEDAAYRELTYEGQVPPSIRSFDREGRHVALLQTFSKPFSPGLKTGYALLPRDLVAPVVIQKGNHDFGSVNLVQELLLAALQRGVFQRHLQRICRGYAAKRDAMLEALDTHLGGREGIAWTRPTGGLYVWLTLPPGADTSPDGPLWTAAMDEGVLYVPGAYCYGPDPSRRPPTHAMRLCYGVADAAQIREGIARLARAVDRVAGSGGGHADCRYSAVREAPDPAVEGVDDRADASR